MNSKLILKFKEFSFFCLILSCVVDFSFQSPSLTCLHLCVLSLELLNLDLQKGIYI